MGLRIADYIDPEDFDVIEGLLPVLMFGAMDEDGEISEENEIIIDDYKNSVEAYKLDRAELYDTFYHQVSMYLYQADKRGLLTEKELFEKLKELKAQTIKDRHALEDKHFPKQEVDSEVDTEAWESFKLFDI